MRFKDLCWMALGLLMVGCSLYWGLSSIKDNYYAPMNGDFKRGDLELPTHYHKDYNCPRLKQEQPDPLLIIRVHREEQEGSVKDEIGNKVLLRQRCTLCMH